MNKKINIRHLAVLAIYLLLLSPIIFVANNIMSVYESDGVISDTVIWSFKKLAICIFVVIFIGFDLLSHLRLHRPLFRLSAIVLLLLSGIWNTYKYYYIFANYESRKISEDIYEVVPGESCFILYWEISGVVLLYLLGAMSISWLLVKRKMKL
ncbi:MAG: hypothetical protein LUD46_11395 [Parabacteroides sp.]|nr:hypothetical protein [Parabacteroides sp.]